MTWQRIRLELARSPNFPEGSTRHGYEFVLPLDEGGKLDRKAYDAAPQRATVHRFWEGEDDMVGEMQRTGRGRWVFSYERGTADDEPIPRLPEHVFREGEYIAVREPDGDEHTFRIVLLQPAPH